MTLKEFYEQIDSDYKDVIKRLCGVCEIISVN